MVTYDEIWTKEMQGLKNPSIARLLWAKIALWGQLFRKNEFSQIYQTYPATRTNGFYKICAYEKKLSSTSEPAQKYTYIMVAKP